MWKVGWPSASHPTQPSTTYTYVYSPDGSAYPYLKTETLNAAGGVMVSYQIFDGLLRPRQTQKAAVGGGRIVADTFHDEQGRANLTFRDRFLTGTPSGTYWHQSAGSVPAETQTIYDRANRATDVVFLGDETDGDTNIVEKWRTTTRYEGDRITVIPPSGGTPATTVNDAQGRTVELRQYTTTAGIGGAYDTTRYAYNRKNQLTTIADPAGNTWTYTYDIKGRQYQVKDPDKATTTHTYNDYNELVTTTDGRGEVLAYEYDTLGRKIGLYDDVVSDSTKRAKWIYDKLYSGAALRGQLTETQRYDGSHLQMAGHRLHPALSGLRRELRHPHR